MNLKGLGRAVAGGVMGLIALLAQPAAAGWPNALPAQPLVQAPRICAPGVVALNRRCKVVDFAKLGETADGRAWYYAFFATRWADRHGRMERGFPVVFFLQPPATLRLALWINDEPGLAGRWSTTPPTRPVLVQRPDGDFIGFNLKAVRGPDDQRLFRRDKLRWKEIDVLHRRDSEQAKLDAVTPHGCESGEDWSIDWPAFRLTVPLRETISRAPCGFVVADMGVKDNKLVLSAAAFSRAEPKAAPATLATPAPLTPSSVRPTSPLR